MKTAAKPKSKALSTRQPWSTLDVLALLLLLLWGGAGLYFAINHITAPVVAKWTIDSSLRDFIQLCLQYGDVVLIILAFINTHLHAARQWSDGAARKWCFIVLVLSYGVECFGTITTFPFGEYHYTDNFGFILWKVPLTIPLAWHIVLTNSLFVVRAVLPHATQTTEAIIAAILCTAYDFVLEPFATTLRHYWTWKGGEVPPLNYVAWFVVSALIIRLFPPTLSTPYRWDTRPWLILGITLSIFIASESR